MNAEVCQCGCQLIRLLTQDQAGKGRKLNKGIRSDSRLVAFLPLRNSNHAKILINRGFSEPAL